MTEKEIVELWQNNRKELRCKQWFIDNHPEAVAWGEKNKKSMLIFEESSRWDVCGFANIDSVYSLSQEFKLPEPVRYYFCNRDKMIHKRDAGSCWVEYDCCVEVPPADLEYVRAQIERKDIDLKEWEYRKLERNEAVTWIQEAGLEFSDVVAGCAGEMRFVRKAGATKSGGWLELENGSLKRQLDDQIATMNRLNNEYIEVCHDISGDREVLQAKLLEAEITIGLAQNTIKNLEAKLAELERQIKDRELIPANMVAEWSSGFEYPHSVPDQTIKQFAASRQKEGLE